jgi:hypothetical protein
MNNVNVWMSQDGRTASFNVCGGDYVKWMGYSLNGIVFVASLWGGGGIDMGWLDGMTGCQVAHLKNLRFRPKTFPDKCLSKTGWPRAYDMIFKIFSPKNRRKNGVFT